MFIFLLVLVFVSHCVASQGQVPATISEQMSTADHLKQAGWWPTKSDAARTEYVGPHACAECHSKFAEGQSQHSMAHTALPAAESPLLGRKDAHYTDGPFSYGIQLRDGGAYYSVTGLGEAFSAPLLWAFGSGNVGQSYLFEQDGTLYEARMSFLNGRGFDLTPGQPKTIPDSLQSAIGRVVSMDEQVKCFSCHTVASGGGNFFNRSLAILGVSCEGCHGPGAAHVALAKSGAATPGMILNPARLTPAQSLDFCGACHRAYWDVADVTDVHAVRFPALRLEQSKCWGNGDARLMCTACHDPHQPLVRTPAAYDAKCLSCHQSKMPEKGAGQSLEPACPVAAKDCVSCHLRKQEIPGMRLSFTDHKIRVY